MTTVRTHLQLHSEALLEQQYTISLLSLDLADKNGVLFRLKWVKSSQRIGLFTFWHITLANVSLNKGRFFSALSCLFYEVGLYKVAREWKTEAGKKNHLGTYIQRFTFSDPLQLFLGYSQCVCEKRSRANIPPNLNSSFNFQLRSRQGKCQTTGYPRGSSYYGFSKHENKRWYLPKTLWGWFDHGLFTYLVCS